MAFNVDFDLHHKSKGAVAQVTGKANSGAADISGATAAPRQFVVTLAESGAMGVPAGTYERVGTSASGNPIYAPYTR